MLARFVLTISTALMTLLSTMATAIAWFPKGVLKLLTAVVAAAVGSIVVVVEGVLS
jgi:hypothetical protein